MKNTVTSALVALVLMAGVAGGAYTLGRSNGRASQGDVIDDCHHVIEMLQRALVDAQSQDEDTVVIYTLGAGDKCRAGKLDPADLMPQD